MARPPTIRVMISSRCKDKISFRGKTVELSEVRKAVKEVLEKELLFDSQLFEVWINEDEPPEEGSVDAWELCLEEVKSADVILGVYNGNAGWAKEAGDIGICHAEIYTAYSSAAAKVRLIKLPEASLRRAPDGKRDARCREYIGTQQRFWGAECETGEMVIDRCKEALRDAVAAMARLGVREARKGKYNVGTALEWSRLNFEQRKNEIERAMRAALIERRGSNEVDGHVFVQFAGWSVLTLCHGLPHAMSVAAARELVGQPFLNDHLYANHLKEKAGGPVHFIGCNRVATESQARRTLGFPDATVATPSFGVYIADNIQKIQLVFLSNCRDEITTRHAVQRVLDWLPQAEEDRNLGERAASRSRIVKAISRENAS